MYGGQTPEAGLCFKSKLLTQMHIRHVDCENTWGQPSLTPVWILVESFCINFRMCVRERILGEAEPRRSEWLQRVLPPGFTCALPGWDGLPSPRLPPSCVCVWGERPQKRCRFQTGLHSKFGSLVSSARPESGPAVVCALTSPPPLRHCNQDTYLGLHTPVPAEHIHPPQDLCNGVCFTYLTSVPWWLSPLVECSVVQQMISEASCVWIRWWTALMASSQGCPEHRGY